MLSLKNGPLTLPLINNYKTIFLLEENDSTPYILHHIVQIKVK